MYQQFFVLPHLKHQEKILDLVKVLSPIQLKIELLSFKSNEHINEKGDGPYHGFCYLSLFSDPTDLAT